VCTLNFLLKRYRPLLATRSLAACFLLLLALVGVARVEAQILKTSGTLEGTISDATGARIPGVKVSLRQIETNQTRTVYADDQGFFRATDLPVGTYEVRIEDPGFAPYLHTGVVLSVGTTAHLDVVLPAASVTSQVTVTAQPSPIDPSQTSVTSAVGRERIEDLPVRSRNTLDFVLLMPGVTSSSQRAGTGSHPALADSGFAFGGLRPRSNNISVDGLDNNDEYTGSSRTELSPEDVQEYQVVNNGLSAEYGGASGGSINVVTRTGSNVLHGDAFIFVENAALNARDPFETNAAKPDFRRYRIGSSMGGPIVKNRTFFHAAFEQESNRGQNGSDIDPSVASAINNFLASGSFPRLKIRQITTDFFPIARAESEASGKLNHQINAQNALMLRYAFTNNREAGDAFNTTGLEDASARGSSFTADHAVVGSLASVFGSRGIGDLRFQAATRHAVLRTNDAAGPGIDINGLVDFGRPYAGNSQRRENHYQASYTYAQTQGRHLWKVGGTVNRVSLHATVLDGFGSLYLFGSLADFLAGRPDSLRQAFGSPDTNYAVTSYGAFLQDHVFLLPRLTVDLGLRYDFEHSPAVFNENTNNFSPRIGLAFSPAPRWVLRAGYGIFYDRQVFANLNRAIAENGVSGFEQVANGTEATILFQGAGGGPLISPATGIAASIFRPDPRLATPYSQQTSLGAEYLIAPDLTASVNYMFVRGVKLSRTRNVNLVPPTVLTFQNAASLGVPNPTPQQIGREVFGPGRSNPGFNDVFLLENSASSTYDGLTISLTRRITKGLGFMTSYTFSKTIDDASDFDEQPQNPFDLRAERAISSQHQQQRFAFNALWNLPIPGKIELAPIITVGTGRPIDPLVGLDSNRSDAFPLSVRPLGFGRNSLQTHGAAIVDLGVVKTIQLGEYRHMDLAAQFFNLFNHVSASAINPFYGTNAVPLAGFGRPIQGVSPRQIQLSLYLEY
jgi:outer membrane receptor for ferrienterochelin and colicin